MELAMIQIPMNAAGRADQPEDDAVRDDGTYEVSSDLAYKRLVLVNVSLVGDVDFNDLWVLVDAGIAGSAHAIADAAERRFGRNARPAAIVLTHGHFDHVGALVDLAEKWNVPIFAHRLEIPYLTGSASYPPPDHSVGGGIMSSLSRFFPRGPIDVSKWLQELPSSGQVPGM